MTHVANIFGYLFGYINLGSWSAIDWIGGGQFRRLAVLSCAVMIICVSITCYTQEETPKRVEGGAAGKGIGLGAALRNVRVAIRVLPVAVQRVCFGESSPLHLSGRRRSAGDVDADYFNFGQFNSSLGLHGFPFSSTRQSLQNQQHISNGC